MSEENQENNINEKMDSELKANLDIHLDIPKTKGEIIQLLKSDVNKFNKIRETNPEWKVDLDGVNLDKTNLSEVNLEKANLTRASLREAKLQGARLRNACLTDVNLTEVDLTSADLTSADLSGANLSGTKLELANLTEAYLIKAKLIEADLSGANLTKAYLYHANLKNSKFDYGTQMKGARVKWVKMYKLSLEQLKDHGGLTNSQLREMKIIYDLGTLRQAFSGWMSFIHIVALILFVLPYIFYLGSQIAISKVIDTSITQSIDIKSKVENDLNVGKEKLNDVLEKELEQVPLAREQKEKILSIVKRKIDDQNKNVVNNLSIRKPNETTIGWALVSYIRDNDFKIFCFLLGYNLLRILLLWKTKSLEHIEAIQGLCSNFTFTGKPQSLEEEGYIKKIVRKVINPIRSTFEIPFQYFLEIIIKLIRFMKSNIGNWVKGEVGGWVASFLERVIDFVADIKRNSKWYRFYIFMEIGFIFNVLLVGCHIIYFFGEKIRFY